MNPIQFDQYETFVGGVCPIKIGSRSTFLSHFNFHSNNCQFQSHIVYDLNLFYQMKKQAFYSPKTYANCNYSKPILSPAMAVRKSLLRRIQKKALNDLRTLV